jgi:hypothetical protein
LFASLEVSDSEAARGQLAAESGADPDDWPADPQLDYAANVALFRRRKGDGIAASSAAPLDVPEGMTAVPIEQINEWAKTLSQEAAQLYDETPPAWLDLAHQRVFLTDEIKAVLGPTAIPANLPTDDHMLMYSAARMGTVSRGVELDAAGEPHANEVLTEFLSYSYDQKTWGEDWFAIVCGAAFALVNAARHRSDDETERELLAPEGLGTDLRDRFSLYGLANLTERVGEERLLTTVLICCWDYGYYLGAVVASLPSQAWADLEAE